MEVLQFLAVAFGSYVFGIIVMMIIRANTMEENECVTLGMLIAMVALVFVHFFGIIFSFVGEFPWERQEEHMWEVMHCLIWQNWQD
jgi:hypothetical protein